MGAAWICVYDVQEVQVRSLLSDNAMWDAFGGRPLSTIVYGGADLGEITSTIEWIADGSADDWYDEWTRTAGRLHQIADRAAERGHPVSAPDTLSERPNTRHRSISGTGISVNYIPSLCAAAGGVPQQGLAERPG